MRICLVFAAVLVAHSARDARACPPLDSCVVALRSNVAVTPAQEEAPETTEALPALHLPLPARPRLAPGEVEMPWIWQSLREQVYSRMPTYEDSHELKIVLSPVVVKSPSDTVPGIGIAGDF